MIKKIIWWKLYHFYFIISSSFNLMMHFMIYLKVKVKIVFLEQVRLYQNYVLSQGGNSYVRCFNEQIYISQKKKKWNQYKFVQHFHRFHYKFQLEFKQFLGLSFGEVDFKALIHDNTTATSSSSLTSFTLILDFPSAFLVWFRSWIPFCSIWFNTSLCMHIFNGLHPSSWLE